MKQDAVCRGCWALGNNCRTCRRCVETATHLCPVCGRYAGPGGWLIHEAYGFRYCPVCREGPDAVPGHVIPVENGEYKADGAAG